MYKYYKNNFFFKFYYVCRNRLGDRLDRRMDRVDRVDRQKPKLDRQTGIYYNKVFISKYARKSEKNMVSCFYTKFNTSNISLDETTTRTTKASDETASSRLGFTD